MKEFIHLIDNSKETPLERVISKNHIVSIAKVENGYTQIMLSSPINGERNKYHIITKEPYEKLINRMEE
ncbi:hypothetical protein [Rhizosphaericola mali]|uniref:Uncharacterized protein n=1 Tax=Rhizosphaericola mali TaxID=2545455 RepID=A0A5P2G3K5_9BACT|nr:hypothetical protein [Rhizosphaericola mali]QES88402.1 hypothetical protein E0W69_006930 [Rhizosphaericola mali]